MSSAFAASFSNIVIPSESSSTASNDDLQPIAAEMGRISQLQVPNILPRQSSTTSNTYSNSNSMHKSFILLNQEVVIPDDSVSQHLVWVECQCFGGGCGFFNIFGGSDTGKQKSKWWKFGGGAAVAVAAAGTGTGAGAAGNIQLNISHCDDDGVKKSL